MIRKVRLWSCHLCYRWPKSPKITVWRSSPNLSRLPITRNRDFWELMVCPFKTADLVKSHVSTIRLSLIPWKRFWLPLNVLMWSKLMFFRCRVYQLHAQPSCWYLQPWSLQHESGHEPTIMQLFHCLIPQHLPDGWPADVTVQSGHVRLGAAGWLPLYWRSEVKVTFTQCQQTGFCHHSNPAHFASSDHFLMLKCCFF